MNLEESNRSSRLGDVERVHAAIVGLIGMEAAAEVVGGMGGVIIAHSSMLTMEARDGVAYWRMELPELHGLQGWQPGGVLPLAPRAGGPGAAFSAQVAGQIAQAFHAGATGTIFLLADRIEPGHEVATYLHEVVHKHGPRVVGAAGMGRLIAGVKAWTGAPAGGLEHAIHGVADARARAMSATPEEYDEELFAYAVEEAVLRGVRPTLEGREGSAEQWLGDVVATLQGVVFEVTRGALPQLDAQRIVDLAYALAQLESPEAGPKIRAQLEAMKAREASEAFRAWFGDSKVVDAEGNPLVVYHGTREDFDQFDLRKQGSNVMNPTTRLGFFFTESAGGAARWASRMDWRARTSGRTSGQNVMPVYLGIEKPRALTAKKFNYMLHKAREGTIDKFVEESRAMGFDGVRISYDPSLDDVAGKASGIEESWWVAFRPAQIKSAIGNNGRYDPASPDIRFSFAGPRAATADLDALAEAKTAIASGRLAEKVRQDTGWFKGVDGKWRFEIDDFGGIAKGVGTFGEVIMRWYQVGVERTGDQLYKTTVSDMLWHPRLYDAYPAIGTMELQMMPAGRDSLGTLMVPDGGEPVGMIQEGVPGSKWRSILMHELQHRIQSIEGFASGGSVQQVARPVATASGHADLGWSLAMDTQQVQRDIYKRLAGEVEARNVQARLGMNAQARQDRSPLETQDTPSGTQIVRFSHDSLPLSPLMDEEWVQLARVRERYRA